MTDVDVVVVGAGVLGGSIAYALACAEPGLRIVLSGRRGPGASQAAGAMLGVLGEVTAAGVRTRHGELRLGMAVEAAARWPAWRRAVRDRAGTAAPPDGYGTGTYILLNAASGPLDEAALEAMRAAGARHGLAVEDSAVSDVPAYRPLDNDRALRAVFLPQERFLDARRWLRTLDTALRALPNVRRAGAGRLRAHGTAYELAAREGTFRAGRVVVAAGAWSSALLDRIDPELPVLPVVAAEGTAVALRPTGPVPPVVLRTPNRAYACGLHAVPQADGTWYLGASAAPALHPGDAPTAGALRFLLDAGLSQLHHGLTGARVSRVHHGNRPVGLDGHPLLGNPGRPGLWVATGTHRDGLHTSPLIAQEIATEILHETPSPWLAPWQPCRKPIIDWTAADAIEEAAAHHAALAAESRMRPPLTGDWPGLLTNAYRTLMEQTYARMPDGYVLPPELAPLGYEQGPALASLVQSVVTNTTTIPATGAVTLVSRSEAVANRITARPSSV
ncbi:FAD-dependent oxidoreductase, partial [Streptomyces sp. NPDC006307]|uniref:NAD(P)/FAD-dependent oxidoreductase n=1 Tax=Streptomyces sp. NPDC006307 TaxID=3156748 RepID=UPI0033BA1501